MLSRIRTALWASRRRRAATIVVTAAVALVGAGAGGVAVAGAIAHDSALTSARTAHTSALDARAEYRQIQGRALGAAAAAATFNEGAGDAAQILSGLVDAQALDDLEAAIAACEATIAKLDGSPARSLPSIEPIPRGEWSTSNLELAAETSTAAAASYTAAAETLSAAIAKLADALDAAEGALVSVAGSATDAVEAAIAAAPSAGQAEKDAARSAASSAAAAEADEAAGALAAYVAAVEAMKASHDAAERAKQQAAAGSGGGSGGGAGGGSSGSGGGGGSSGGGSGGGTPVDTNRYADPRGPYTPGCSLGGLIYTHDPGPGGTSVINSVSVPYDYFIDGNLVKVYACR